MFVVVAGMYDSSKNWFLEHALIRSFFLCAEIRMHVMRALLLFIIVNQQPSWLVSCDVWGLILVLLTWITAVVLVF